MLERAGFDKILAKLFKPFQHLYTLLIVLIGWVFFRVEEFTDAISYLARMIGISPDTKDFVWLDYMNNYSTTVLIIGLLLSLDLPNLGNWLENKGGALTKNVIYTELKSWRNC